MPKTNKSKKKTHLAIVLDRSGSMMSIRKQALDALNETLSGITRDGSLGGETDVTIVLFDTAVETLIENVPHDMLPEITEEQYEPRGLTALYDAVNHAIDQIVDPNETDDTAYLVTTISDGEENSSRTVNQQMISNRIKDLEATGKWTFNFMLANQDIHKFVQDMGVRGGNVTAFTSTAAGVVSGSYALTGSYSTYLSARHSGYTTVGNTFDPASVVSGVL
jgi:hypothetical protein